MGDLTPLEEDIDVLADAVVQLYQRLRDYEAEHSPIFRS
jgi:hypothetical protein